VLEVKRSLKLFLQAVWPVLGNSLTGASCEVKCSTGPPGGHCQVKFSGTGS
jgi:hypothetical protein